MAALTGEELMQFQLPEIGQRNYVRHRIADRLGISPMGLTLVVAGHIWEMDPPPAELAETRTIQFLQRPPTLAELREALAERLGRLSRNASQPMFTRIFLCSFNASSWYIFEQLRPHFTVIGYMGLARILIIRDCARNMLLEVQGLTPLTQEDVIGRMLEDDRLWSTLARVDRMRAMDMLMQMHVQGEIDLAEHAQRWGP